MEHLLQKSKKHEILQRRYYGVNELVETRLKWLQLQENGLISILFWCPFDILQVYNADRRLDGGQILFTTCTLPTGRKLHKQNHQFCIWRLKKVFYSVLLSCKLAKKNENVVLLSGLQLLIQADASCKLCTILSELFLL